MINVTLTDTDGTFKLTVTGHAGAAEHGHDIICASASILAYTLAQSVQDCCTQGRLAGNPVVRLSAGSAEIIARPTREACGEVRTIYNTITRGYELLSRNYPDYLTIVTRRKPSHKHTTDSPTSRAGDLKP